MPMVHLVRRPTGNTLVFFDAYNPFLIFFLLDIPPCTSSKFHFLCHVPGLVLHLNQFSAEIAAVLAQHAHMESRPWAPATRPHIWTQVAGSTHPGPRNCTVHQGKNKGGHLKRKLYFYGKWKIKEFSVIRNDEGLRTWHRVCRCIFLKGYVLELNFKLMFPIPQYTGFASIY